MRTNLFKHLLSLSALALFLLLAAASSKKTLGCGAFDSRAAYGRDKDTRQLLWLKDGSQLEGERLVVQSGLLVRDGVKLDGTMYKFDEVAAYQRNGKYYKRFDRFFGERLVDGKSNLNVYMHQYERTTTSTAGNGRMSTSTRVYCDYYVLKGENGTPVQILTQEDLARIVADCPKAVAQVQMKNKEMRKLIRDNPRYLNEIFETYNAGCR
jgi:hypothetical protein